jgi:hypothetical protein
MYCLPAIRTIAVLTLLVAPSMTAQTRVGSKTATVAKDYSFTVDGKELWLDTGLDLQEGDLVFVYGGVLACGGPSLNEKAHLPLPSAPGGALLAKLHPEAKPVLATPDAELPVIDPSRLYLGVNGAHCTGKLPAKVHVETAERQSHPR